MNNLTKSKCPGAYPGAERREPETKSSRNLEIALLAKGINKLTKSKRPGAYSGSERLKPGAKSRRI